DLAGYRVSAAAGQRPAPTHWSRSCSERLRVTGPTVDADAFLAGLESIVSSRGYDLLMAGTDASLLAISSGRERLEPHVRLALPDHETVERCFDKWSFVERAEAVGLAAPETVFCETTEAALAAAAGFGYPVVLKSRFSADRVGGAIRHRGSRPVASAEALMAAVPRYGLPCLVQRRQAGSVISTSAVATDEGLIGFGASRYLRTFPPQGGSVSFSESIEPPAGLEQKVARLLAGTGWRGVFELELLELAGGELAAIDLNPRFYGSMALASAAGAPLAALWCDRVLDGSTARVRAAAGRYYRWEDADLRHMLWQLRRGHLKQALQVLRPRRRVVHSLFRSDDPGPLLARLVLMARHSLVRRRARKRPR
ncbi:MAG: hypothetical protein QOG09_657, partial [Solirubrobacterales bacterium]|nr:hypothetical protein [Solirubrobacterales bacterium]